MQFCCLTLNHSECTVLARVQFNCYTQNMHNQFYNVRQPVVYLDALHQVIKTALWCKLLIHPHSFPRAICTT